MVQSHFRVTPKDATLVEILDRILDKGIVLDSWARVVAHVTDFRNKKNRIVVAPERRSKPFIVPAKGHQH